MRANTNVCMDCSISSSPEAAFLLVSTKKDRGRVASAGLKRAPALWTRSCTLVLALLLAHASFVKANLLFWGEKGLQYGASSGERRLSWESKRSCTMQPVISFVYE